MASWEREAPTSRVSFVQSHFRSNLLAMTLNRCIVLLMHPFSVRGSFLVVLAVVSGFFFPAPAPAAIVINEIHYNPDVKTERAEFIELFNAGTNAVNLAGWFFSDAIDYTFPATNVAPGRFVVVA